MRRTALLTALLLLPILLWGGEPGRVFGDDAGERLDPGAEGPLAIPGSDFPCRLYVPKDYEKGVRLPLILFLHGSGGKPTSWPWKTATGGEGYFIVGMSYGSQPDGGAGGIRSDAASRAEMVKFIEQVRALVHERYGIDPKRVFLTGLSMGGWGVNFYGFRDDARGRYRGYCIMAAGITGNPTPDLSVLEGLPLLLLNGEKDANLAAAHRGVPLFRKAGAIVEQVVIPGEGHVPSTASMAKPLKAWLDGIEQADEQQRALAAVKFAAVELAGEPTRDGGSKEDALRAWLVAQPFLAKDAAGKPALLFLGTDHTDKRGEPSKQARETERVDAETFGYPAAHRTPAAARPYACFRASIGAWEKSQHPLLNRTLAPLVLLVDRERSALRLLTKAKLEDAALAKALRAYLTEEEAASVDRRIAQTKPTLVEMRKLRKSIESEKKALTKLRKKPAARVQKKLAKHTAALEALTKRYEELHAKLAD